MKGFISMLFRLFLGIVLIATGLDKISDPAGFFPTVCSMNIFSGFMVPFMTIFLPWLEFIIGILILLGQMTRASSLLSSILHLFLAMGIYSMIARGIKDDCSCFSLSANLFGLPDGVDYKSVIKNIIFMCMSIYIFTVRTSMLTLDKYIINKKFHD